MDGTLTPARLPMTAEFAIHFYEWQKNHKSFIATGSDLKKVGEQLPPSIIQSFSGIYSSMGNVLTAKDELVYKRDFKPEKELLDKLEYYRQNTTYPGELYPNYIEQRIGMINFSVLGRNCPHEERNKYSVWDKVSGERQRLADELRAVFPQYDISIGGSIFRIYICRFYILVRNGLFFLACMRGLVCLYWKLWHADVPWFLLIHRQCLKY